MRRPWFLLAAALVLSVAPATAQGKNKDAAAGESGKETADAVLLMRAVQPAGDADAGRFASALASAIDRYLSGAGLSRREAEPPEETTPAALAAAADAAGCRWAVLASCVHNGKRVTWTALLVDSRDGAILAADTFAAFPGLSALTLVEGSAGTVAKALSRAQGAGREITVASALRLTSKNEGAKVFFGDLLLGVVADGSLTAPWIAFKQGQSVELRIEKEGYRTRSFSAELKAGEDVALPSLEEIHRQTLVLDYGLGRLLGAGLAYRYAFPGERIFVEGQLAPWVTDDFRPGSVPILHAETGLSVGFFPFQKAGSHFRVGLSMGLSGLFTLFTAPDLADPFAFDLALMPFRMEAQYSLKSLSLFAEMRMLYSFGLDKGLLPRGWLSLPSVHGPLVSAGVVLPCR